MAVTIVALLVLAGAWRGLAPAKLGGTTTYAVTEGISMEPSIHAGALVLVRPTPSYKVGDVVLYDSSVVGRPVLHRVLLIQGGNYFFQGDNNDFVDPGYATPPQLIGKLWLRIPRIGTWLSWVGHPRNAALLASLAALGIGLTAVPAKRRRHRRSTEIPAPLDPSAATTTMSESMSDPADTAAGDVAASDGAVGKDGAVGLSGSRPPAFLDGPLPTLVGFAISLLLAGLLLGVGFALPAQRMVSRPDAYRQSGTFSYQAKPRMNTPVYPSGVVKTGDPIYPSLVDLVTVTFRYHFTSSLPHSVKGTISMQSVLQSQDGTWQTLSTLKSATKFSGDRATVTAQITLRDLYALLNTVTAQTGAEATAYSADLEPVVRLTGHVGNSAIDSDFSPTLPVEIDPSAITLKVTTGAPPPGATYIPPSREEELSSTLTPVIAGALPVVGPNVVTVAHYHPSVTALRTAGIVFGVLALILMATHDIWRRRTNRKSQEEVIARRLGVPLVPVDELRTIASTTVGVPDFSYLAELARYLERPVLYLVHEGTPTFAVDDGQRSYRFTRRQTQSEHPLVQKDATPVEQQDNVRS